MRKKGKPSHANNMQNFTCYLTLMWGFIEVFSEMTARQKLKVLRST